MCTLGNAAALGEGMGSIGAKHLQNQVIQLAPFVGLLSFFAFWCLYWRSWCLLLCFLC